LRQGTDADGAEAPAELAGTPRATAGQARPADRNGGPAGIRAIAHLPGVISP
jgi:hypothetical protein